MIMFISLDQEKMTEFGQNSITPSEGDVKINTLSIINGMEIGTNKSKEDEVEEKPVNFLLMPSYP